MEVVSVLRQGNGPKDGDFFLGCDAAEQDVPVALVLGDLLFTQRIVAGERREVGRWCAHGQVEFKESVVVVAPQKEPPGDQVQDSG